MNIRLLRSRTLSFPEGVHAPKIGFIRYGNGFGLFVGDWLLQVKTK